MALLLDPAVQMHGWAMEAPILFLEYVFNTWPLRKIYMETYEFNYASIQSGADRMFEVEGCLLDYEFQDGEYWHKYILAVSRERWQSIAERLRRLVRPVRPDRGAPRDHEVG